MMLLDLFMVLTECALSLKLVVAAFVLGGLAAELLSRRKFRIRWVIPVVCLCVMAVTEVTWQMHPSEYLILFYSLGWFAEAALFGCAFGAAIWLIRKKSATSRI